MAEAGIPESTMLALMGHMSRAMLERYSHIRMAAKRIAVESLAFTPKQRIEESAGVPSEQGAGSSEVSTALPVNACATVQ
jgi:hypothetical protein